MEGAYGVLSGTLATCVSSYSYYYSVSAYSYYYISMIYLCVGRYACDPEVVRAAIEGVAAQTGGAKKA